jgi:PAS domain S-box-containing protein
MQGTPIKAPQPDPRELELITELFYRQYDILFRLTTQMLATRNVDERLSLVLDAVTSDLGYTHAAVSLIDSESQALRLRMSLGFPDDDGIAGRIVPSTLGAPLGNSTGTRPAWIQRDSSEAEREFLNAIGCDTDLLALPLFGGHWLTEKQDPDYAHSRWWDVESHVGASSCIGMLYIACTRKDSTAAELNLLLRLADRVGLTIALSEQNERLTTTIARFEREREWVNAITQSVADPIVLTNLDNQILLQNKRAEELFSGSEDENVSEGKIRALKMNDLLFSAYLSSVGFTSGDAASRDLTLVDPIEGSDVHFEVVSTPAHDSLSQRIGLVSVFRDVTDLRKANDEMVGNLIRLQQAEAEARHERDRLDLIIENVGHPVVVGDSGGNLILFNRKAEVFFENTDPSPRALAALRANSVKLTSFISALASDPFAARQSEIELINPETGEVLPMEITSVEVQGPRGQVTAVVSILHDLSSIRELERRRVQQQLFESEKLAAIGRLTASIAHEINNPLEAVKNSLYLLQTGTDQQSKRFLEIALKETERVSHIIGQMLGFARGRGEIEWVNINETMEETLVLLDKKFKQTGTKVALHFEKDLPKIHARADQLKQVFLNLLMNAQQSLAENKGRITIKTASMSISVSPSVSIEISDTGAGIAEDELTRIFEPFFSTRKKGTGLGLWVTQDIVRHHGGRIEVTSVLNRGTTFRIVLPLEPPQPDQMQPPAALSA